MNKIVSSILAVGFLFAFSVNASPIGAQIVSDKKQQNSIYLECIIESEVPCQHAVFVLNANGVKKTFDHWTVPMMKGQESYSVRWGTFIEIATEASVRMPPVPEFRYVYLANASMKAYRTSFEKLESIDQKELQIPMKDLFFKKLIESLELK